MTQHPESRDEWDDRLDSLLAGADADLRASLTDAFDVASGVRAVLGSDPLRSATVGTLPEMPASVSYQILRLTSHFRHLLESGYHEDNIVKPCLLYLAQLRQKLGARCLTWDQANQYIQTVEARLEKMFERWREQAHYVPSELWEIADQAVMDLGTLRRSVKRLFEDSDEWSENMAPRW
ncbi:MAG TPA: hypothetical protein VGX25_09745 [Actinophytocola sp.]|uniref:hypothetical protein n=1 Tax=Actinophytocola sp. TaxID=1872138 RepID=UPI002DDD61A2|nr:hypothetical protein [Actinophytocola sp.]HEV2779670.1 hypothetical protein [Actinophytocola sp.]